MNNRFSHAWRPGFLHAVRTSEFFRYFLVSLIAFIADLISFSIGFRFLDLSWPIAASFSFLLGVAIAYFLSIHFVFSRRKFRGNPVKELFSFTVIGLGGLGVTQITLWVGIELLRYSPEISKIGAAGFTFLFNFFVRKLMLFNIAANHSSLSIHINDNPS